MPELLDSQLEAEMRSLLFWLVVPLFFMGFMWLVTPVSAFEIPFTDIELFGSEKPVLNEASPIYPKETALPIEFKEIQTDDLWTQIKGIISLTSGKKVMVVLYKDEFLAELPEGSRFEGVPVHATCLNFQYGTEDWYTCEMGNV